MGTEFRGTAHRSALVHGVILVGLLAATSQAGHWLADREAAWADAPRAKGPSAPLRLADVEIALDLGPDLTGSLRAEGAELARGQPDPRFPFSRQPADDLRYVQPRLDIASRDGHATNVRADDMERVAEGWRLTGDVLARSSDGRWLRASELTLVLPGDPDGPHFVAIDASHGGTRGPRGRHERLVSDSLLDNISGRTTGPEGSSR